MYEYTINTLTMETDKNAQRYNSFGEYLYWIYANLNMCNAAIDKHKKHYDRTCFMIRAKAFKAYKEGRWQIHSLYDNNNWKMDWGKEYCWYCGESLDKCGKLTAEHIFPRAKGGDNSFDNIAYACKKCNSSKGDKDLIVWITSTLKIVPDFSLTCIYLKLVYKYAIEHHLMDLHSEDLDAMSLPFDHHSLMIIEHLIRDYYLERYNNN